MKTLVTSTACLLPCTPVQVVFKTCQHWLWVDKKDGQNAAKKQWASWARGRVMQVFHCWWFRNPSTAPTFNLYKTCCKSWETHRICSISISSNLFREPGVKAVLGCFGVLVWSSWPGHQLQTGRGWVHWDGGDVKGYGVWYWEMYLFGPAELGRL